MPTSAFHRFRSRLAACVLGLAMAVAASAFGTTSAQAQLQSCVGSLSTASTNASGCLDYTITNNAGTTGYIQFQLTYERDTISGLNSGNPVLVITGMQAAYAYVPSDGATINGFGLPAGGAPGAGNFAPIGGSFSDGDGFNETYYITSTGAIACYGSGCAASSGERDPTFSFNALNDNDRTITFRDFTSGGSGAGVGGFANADSITVEDAGNFDCGASGNNGSNGGRCRYGLTSSFGNPIAAIPEIDGGRVSQILLLLSGLYLVFRRRSKEDGEPV